MPLYRVGSSIYAPHSIAAAGGVGTGPTNTIGAFWGQQRRHQYYDDSGTYDLPDFGGSRRQGQLPDAPAPPRILISSINGNDVLVTSLTCPLPAGSHVGDTCVVHGHQQSGLAWIAPSPSGYTEIHHTKHASNTAQLTIWAKTLTASDISTGSVTISISSARNMNCTIYVLPDHDVGAVGATVSNVTNPATAFDLPTITPATDGMLLISMASSTPSGTNGISRTYTIPDGWERPVFNENPTTATPRIAILGYSKVVPDGAGLATAAATITNATGGINALAVTISFTPRPAPTSYVLGTSSADSAGANVNDLTLQLPPWISAGDVGYLVMETSTAVTQVAPSGWDVVGGTYQTTTSLRSWLYRRTMNGTESSTFITPGVGTSAIMSASVVVVTGVNAATEVIAADESDATDMTPHPMVAVTPSVDDALLLYLVSVRYSSVDQSGLPPAGHIEVVDHSFERHGEYFASRQINDQSGVSQAAASWIPSVAARAHVWAIAIGWSEGLSFTLWNGTTEEPLTATLWNGTTEEPLTIAVN